MSHNYQDRYVKGDIIGRGERTCEDRYIIVKKFLEQYNRPFTVLDLGAAQGYFCLRISQDFPDSVCIGVEKSYAGTFKELLVQNGSDNVILIEQDINKDFLKRLSDAEHFDVVIAFNIMHHLEGDLSELYGLIMSLGDHLLVETPPLEDKRACGQDKLGPILKLIQATDHVELGETLRHTSNLKSKIIHIHHPKYTLNIPYVDAPKNTVEKKDIRIESDFDHKIFISERKGETRNWIPGINLQTFKNFRTLYPDRATISNILSGLPLIFVDHKDLNPWNIIIGKGLQPIDSNDPENEAAAPYVLPDLIKEWLND